MIYAAARRLLFRLDAESAHEWTVKQIRRVQKIPIALRLIERLCAAQPSPVKLWDLTFRNPIGIAAGFDKNAVMMPFLAALGFGFIEVGTVTLHPQPGNPRPRLFRDPARGALINRLGFNNDGADAVAERLGRLKPATTPLFVNIGKNRDVPLEAAPESYARCAEKLAKYADALVINISSPTTPGLRDLQRPEHLEKVVGAVAGRKLVKIAPDLDDAQIAEICDVCVKRADGIICKAVHPVSLATLLRETVHGNIVHSFAGTDGPDAVAQVDLGVRVHRNRPLHELRPMAVVVLQTALRRAGVPLGDATPDELPPLVTPRR